MRGRNCHEVVDRGLLEDRACADKTCKPPALPPIFVELCVRDCAPGFPEFLLLTHGRLSRRCGTVCTSLCRGLSVSFLSLIFLHQKVVLLDSTGADRLIAACSASIMRRRWAAPAPVPAHRCRGACLRV